MQANTAATAQAMERMGHGNGNGNGNGEGAGNGLGGGVPMTLATFLKTLFYKKYFPESMREARKLVLMQLKQESMTVAQYTSKFEELYRFSRVYQGAPESYEGWKCIKYQGGLKDDIMTVVALVEIRRFSELVNKARVVEEVPGRGQNFKRNGHTSSHVQGQGEFGRNSNTHFHPARGSGRCYTCGMPGYLAKDYCHGRNQDAGRNQQPGQVFALDASEPKESDPLMRGKSVKLLDMLLGRSLA
ncbi:hypothetical protein AHAS_Ahas11G0093700 [Arachis hypogaea]